LLKAGDRGDERESNGAIAVPSCWDQRPIISPNQIVDAFEKAAYAFHSASAIRNWLPGPWPLATAVRIGDPHGKEIEILLERLCAPA
jgi:hypothetical protein